MSWSHKTLSKILLKSSEDDIICKRTSYEEGCRMMYGFMTLNDGTEINHSEAKIVDGKEVVKVYIERPVMNGFDSAECYLPAYEWKNIVGFSKYEIEQLQDFIKSVAHIIIELAREGGFAKYAANI